METSNSTQPADAPECFVIMPIGKAQTEEHARFSKVLKDIIEPACNAAGYKAHRADQSGGTALIHVNMLTRLFYAPMAVCDLTGWNPNVLFELGFRQAFNKPVVLIQEEGTERVFDTGVLNTFDYGKGFEYRRVQEDQEKLAKALRSTAEPGKESVNSLVKLIELSPAHLSRTESSNQREELLHLIRAEIESLRADVQALNQKPIPTLIEELKRRKAGGDPAGFLAQIADEAFHATSSWEIAQIELKWATRPSGFSMVAGLDADAVSIYHEAEIEVARQIAVRKAEIIDTPKRLSSLLRTLNERARSTADAQPEVGYSASGDGK